MKAIIDPHDCLRCEQCPAEETCPTKAIFKVDLGSPAVVEQQYCYGCGDCVEKCIGKAITIE